MKAALDQRWSCPDVWEVVIGWRDHRLHADKLGLWTWRDAGGGRMCTRQETRADIEPLVAVLREAGAGFQVEESYRGIPWGLGREAQKHLKVDQFAIHEAVTRWYRQQWLGLAEQTRTNVVTGLAVFLADVRPPGDGAQVRAAVSGRRLRGVGGAAPLPAAPLRPDGVGQGPRVEHARGREPQSGPDAGRDAQAGVAVDAAAAAGADAGGVEPGPVLAAGAVRRRRVPAVRHGRGERSRAATRRRSR